VEQAPSAAIRIGACPYASHRSWTGQPASGPIRRLFISVHSVKISTRRMKTSQCICLWLLIPCNLLAQPAPNPEFWEKAISSVPAPEIPPLAAKWVSQSAPADRLSVTVAIVEAAERINPAVCPLVVAAISRAVPEMAAVAAATATAKQTTQAVAISKAATAAAPAMAARIVEALCKTCPEQYCSIAVAAAEAAPTAGTQILSAVASARPDLRPFLEYELAKPSRTTPSVAVLLARTQLAQTNTSNMGPTPAISPLASDSAPAANPNGGKPNNGSNGWRGGRNYARP